MSCGNIPIFSLAARALTHTRAGLRRALRSPVVWAWLLAGTLTAKGILDLSGAHEQSWRATGYVVLGLILPAIAQAHRIHVLRTERDRMRIRKEALVRADLLWHDEMLQARMCHSRHNRKMLKDLHDTVGGISTNIGMLAEVAQGHSTPEEMRKTLAAIATLSRENVDEVRSFMQSLDARELNWHSFMAELTCHGFTVTEPHHISFSFDAPEPEDRLPPPGSFLYLNILRIYKEALTNVVKHAGARTVAVTMRVTEDFVMLTIQDDGRGMPDAPAKGRGLANMRTRAEELGGTFAATSEGGTRINVRIPLPTKPLEQGISP